MYCDAVLKAKWILRNSQVWWTRSYVWDVYICLSICLCVYTNAHIHIIYAHICIYICVYIHAYLHAYNMYVVIYIYAHIDPYTHTYMHTYKQTSMPNDAEYIQTCVHTHMNTYIQANIQTCQMTQGPLPFPTFVHIILRSLLQKSPAQILQKRPKNYFSCSHRHAFWHTDVVCTCACVRESTYIHIYIYIKTCTHWYICMHSPH